MSVQFGIYVIFIVLVLFGKRKPRVSRIRLIAKGTGFFILSLLPYPFWARVTDHLGTTGVFIFVAWVIAVYVVWCYTLYSAYERE
jgi:hypothetical protein